MQRGIQELAAAGYRWVVVHPDLFANDKVRAAHNHALEETLGQSFRLEDKLVWEIKP